jgi:predicted O-methyltransferase YrrM
MAAAMTVTAQLPDEIRSLCDILRRSPPKALLEIGVLEGGSLLLFAQSASAEATLIGLDVSPPPEVPHGDGQTLHLVAGDSHAPATIEAVRRILNGEQLDFLFIDGDHFGAMADYLDYGPLVKPNGIIAFHDIHPGPPDFVGTVPEVWERIKEGKRFVEFYQARGQQVGYGIGVMWKE